MNCLKDRNGDSKHNIKTDLKEKCFIDINCVELLKIGFNCELIY
jgi:hypothetical protein